MNGFLPWACTGVVAAIRATTVLAMYLALTPAWTNAAESPDDLFSRANTAFLQNDFEEAIELYEAASRQMTSSSLHFNLANAYYRIGAIGPAVLHFERALLLDPGNIEARSSLQQIRSILALAIPRRSMLQHLGAYLRDAMWAWLLVLLFWSAIAFWIIPSLYRRDWPFAKYWGVFFLLLSGLCGAILYANQRLRNDAVVMRDDVPVHVSPIPTSPQTGRVHAGDVVRVIRSHDQYYFLESSVHNGWINRNSVHRIRDFSDHTNPDEVLNREPDSDNATHMQNPEDQSFILESEGPKRHSDIT